MIELWNDDGQRRLTWPISVLPDETSESTRSGPRWRASITSQPTLSQSCGRLGVTVGQGKPVIEGVWAIGVTEEMYYCRRA